MRDPFSWGFLSQTLRRLCVCGRLRIGGFRGRGDNRSALRCSENAAELLLFDHVLEGGVDDVRKRADVGAQGPRRRLEGAAKEIGQKRPCVEFREKRHVLLFEVAVAQDEAHVVSQCRHVEPVQVLAQPVGGRVAKHFGIEPSAGFYAICERLEEGRVVKRAHASFGEQVKRVGRGSVFAPFRFVH